MKFFVGIDEVGRGCLAGPVMIAAVAIQKKFRVQSSKFKVPLRDSKKLTAKQREKWFDYIKKHPKISYIAARCQPVTVDKVNISKAANIAAERAFMRLLRTKNLEPGTLKIFLDGGLYLRPSVRSSKFAVRSRTVVRGDQKYNCIKLASIVAKVYRDRFMKKVHKKYPKYGFDEHKGYGTRQHIRAVKRHGPSEIHRLTFIKNFCKV